MSLAVPESRTDLPSSFYNHTAVYVANQLLNYWFLAKAV